MSLSTHVVRSPRRQSSLRGVALAAVVAVIAVGSIRGARAQAGEPRFALNASGAGVTCDKPSEPTECNVGLGASFTLSIEVLDPPAAGYLAMQTQLYLDGLTWTPASVQEENVWPDNQLPIRSPDVPEPGVIAVSHGGLTALSQPLPLSHYEGPLVELQMSCSAAPASFSPSLIALNPAVAPLGTSLSLEALGSILPAQTIGTADLDVNQDGFTREVPVAYILGIKCGQSAPEPEGPPNYQEGNFPDQALPTVTPVGGTRPPNQETTPGRNNTPNATAGDETPATPGPGVNNVDDDDGGGAPWAIIGVVIGAVVVAGAGGAYLWYLRRGRSQT